VGDAFVWLALSAAVAVVALVWRRVFPKPFPPWLTPILDTRFRRRTFSPELAAERHGISDGMRVLEIGPGNGYLTAIARRRVGPTGMLICLDIQLPMLQKLRRTLGEETPALVSASGSRLPLRDGSIDLAFLCDVLGEIPDKKGAFHELHRILKPGGTLAITEALPDPDYVRASVLTGLARGSGFLPAERFGSWFQYTQRFTRVQ
jgi:ubiquinone/menaquinone biosynthesis C-methylase UbiE